MSHVLESESDNMQLHLDIWYDNIILTLGELSARISDVRLHYCNSRYCALCSISKVGYYDYYDSNDDDYSEYPDLLCFNHFYQRQNDDEISVFNVDYSPKIVKSYSATDYRPSIDSWYTHDDLQLYHSVNKLFESPIFDKSILRIIGGMLNKSVKKKIKEPEPPVRYLDSFECAKYNWAQKYHKCWKCADLWMTPEKLRKYEVILEFFLAPTFDRNLLKLIDSYGINSYEE